MKRSKLSAGANRSNFRRGNRVNGKNHAGAPMRGGIRL